MKTVKTTRRTNLSAPLCLLFPFCNATKSLRGEPTGIGQWRSLGMLSGGDLMGFMTDDADIDYVVYSYATPIAWHTPRGWYVVQQRFSVTTSRHQSQVRQGIAGIE